MGENNGFDELKNMFDQLGITLDDLNSRPKLSEEDRRDIKVAEDMLRNSIENEDVVVKSSFDEPFNGTGALSATGNVIKITDQSCFEKVFEKATVFEVYIQDNKPVIEFTFKSKEV